ncbi:poliovirus receptor isoform X2 [Octodon degus]|uniref:Poliovirus receptor isoform X2 n=1 Tax=Octodon degus TaxID=10160 RepID=A0A6P6DJT5_OCTDE|nr:poliovirus receptor isoform X2 [Octodon degus]
MAHAVLWLLLLFVVPLRDGLETLSLQIPSQVLGVLGKKVKLPCQLQGLKPDTKTTITQLTWELQKSGGEAPQLVAIFHPSRGSQVKESEDPHKPQRMEFESARVGGDLRDASLVLWAVRREDEGTYMCHISTFPQGSASGKTELLVRALPQNRVELQEATLDLTPGNLVPVAQCISEGGWPPPQVSWLLGDLGDSNETIREHKKQEPGPLPDTVTVTSVLMMVPSGHVNGKNVTCRVEHETLEKPDLLSVRLSVSYLPQVSISGYDDNWYLGRKAVTLTCEVDSNPEDVNVVWNTATSRRAAKPHHSHRNRYCPGSGDFNWSGPPDLLQLLQIPWSLQIQLPLEQDKWNKRSEQGKWDKRGEQGERGPVLSGQWHNILVKWT